MNFAERYGPWALIAGASEGIGEAFAVALSDRGLNVVLVARREEPLAKLAARLPVQSRIVSADLSSSTGTGKVCDATADLEIGLVVCNAALSPIGLFTTVDPEMLERALDLNARAPVVLARHYLPPMVERGRGGLIIMSSLSGMQGSPGIATYAGTKAFGAVFAEGLWRELRPHGVDALACIAGAVSTPGLARNTKAPAPGAVAPEVVATAALRGLGRGPRVVPGALMAFSNAVLSRLPRRWAINIMASASRDTLGF